MQEQWCALFEFRSEDVVINIPNIINTILATVFALTPVVTATGSIQIQDEVLSTVADSPCYAFQPDLSLGKVIYYKGQATINGAVPHAGDHLHNGDVLDTALDGFFALELSNGKRLSVQPTTHLTIVCSPMGSRKAMFNKPEATLELGIPHLSGAVRG